MVQIMTRTLTLLFGLSCIFPLGLVCYWDTKYKPKDLWEQFYTLFFFCNKPFLE